MTPKWFQNFNNQHPHLSVELSTTEGSLTIMFTEMTRG